MFFFKLGHIHVIPLSVDRLKYISFTSTTMEVPQHLDILKTSKSPRTVLSFVSHCLVSLPQPCRVACYRENALATIHRIGSEMARVISGFVTTELRQIAVTET